MKRPHVIANLYDFLFFVEHKKRYFEDVAKQHWTPLTFILFHFIVNIHQNIIFCILQKKERQSKSCSQSNARIY